MVGQVSTGDYEIGLCLPREIGEAPFQAGRGGQLPTGRPPVYDQVVLAFPVQPLCRPDCAGLCQICGGNRNEASCTCRAESGDPRFALLKNLSFSEPS